MATGSTLDTDKEEGDADTTTNSTLPDDHPPSHHHRHHHPHPVTKKGAAVRAGAIPKSIYEMPPVMSADELLAELQKRLGPDDNLPQVGPLRRRKRPTCQFLNFLGTRRGLHRPQDQRACITMMTMPPPTTTTTTTTAAASYHHHYPHEVETQRFLSEIDFGLDEHDDDDLNMDPIPAFSSKFKHSPQEEDEEEDHYYRYLHLKHHDDSDFLTKEDDAPLSPPPPPRRKKQRRDTMILALPKHGATVTGGRA